MQRKRISREAIVALVGGYTALFGGCLPDDYLAASGRSISVAIADTLLAAAISPVFNAILPPLSNDNGNDNSNDSE